MSIQKIKEGNSFNTYTQSFLIDSADDLDDLEQQFHCSFGDEARTPDGTVYIRHSDSFTGDKWVVKSSGSSGSGSSDLPAVTSNDNGNVLTVVDGAWSKAEPPYTVEKNNRVILEETTLDFTNQGGINITLFDPLYIPNDGEMITVFWGENEYHCQATTITNSNQTVTYFGANLLAFSGSDADWDEFPFVFEIITESGTTTSQAIIVAESGNSILASAEASFIIVNPSTNFIKAISEISGLTVNEIDSKQVLSKTAKEIIDIYSLSLPILAFMSETSGTNYSYTLLFLANIEINYSQSYYYFSFYDMAHENLILFGTTNINEYPEYPFKIPFTIDNKTYYHDPGFVSWSTWVNTEDNVDGFTVSSNTVYSENGYMVCTSDGTPTPASVGIGTNISYITVPNGEE